MTTQSSSSSSASSSAPPPPPPLPPPPPPPPPPQQSRSSASSKSRGKRIKYSVENIDWISSLPDELLEKILSTLPLESAVKTSVLSKRWIDLWKRRLRICVDMRFIMQTTPSNRIHRVSKCFAESMTKTINNHRGRLESCAIRHYVTQCLDGTLERWVHTVTRVKHTKELQLVNYLGCMGPFTPYNKLYLAPSTFSHHSLTSLSLTRYNLSEKQAFNHCSNLKILKLYNITAHVRVLSRIFRACSSLEVLVLQITQLHGRSRLKIMNENLEFLQVTCPIMIYKLEVNAARLEILDIKYIFCERDNFILDAPGIQFNRNYWNTGGSYPHISFNVSSALAQEKKRIWFELMVRQFHDMRRTGSLSVRIDVTNPKELEILKEILLLWGEEMKELEIIFKNNTAPREEEEEEEEEEEGESSINGEKPFPDAFFRVSTIRMYNFSGSNEEEFALASRFVKQGTVIDKLMIETSAYPPMKKLMTEVKVAKLMKIPKGDDDFTIECF